MTMRDNGGWDNFGMILIQTIQVANIFRSKEEREFIELLTSSLNKSIPSRSKE